MPLEPEPAEPVAQQPAQHVELMNRLRTAGASEVNSLDYPKTGMDVDALVTPQSLGAVASALKQEHFALDSLVGIDRNPGFEVLYLFKPFTDGPRVRLRAKAEAEKPELPTLSKVYAGADWYEREIHDMFGVKFTDHPHLRPLLLPHFTNFYPLRKEFHGAPIVIPDDTVEIPEIDVQEAMKVGQSEGRRRDFFLNMGPQHPSTHGVLRILLHVEGEKVLGGRCHLGYSHRGSEKLAEKKQYVQILPYTDRMDYLAPLNYNLGYAKLLERAAGIESTPRAEVLRLIMAELGRVASHLVWLGTYLLDLGAITPFLYCFEDRERILTIFERATGQRMTTSYIVYGGVRNDVYSEFSSEIANLIKDLRKRMPEYDDLVMSNEIFLQRTDGVGTISREQAIEFGVSGPVLRGSGVDYDARRDEPYCDLYQEFEWKVATDPSGDCLGRSRVRMAELVQSFNLIEQGLAKLEDGPVRSKVPRIFKVPEGEYFSATEGPRGMLGWYLVGDGSANPYRLKVRVPSFANLQVVEELIKGMRVADVVSILGSLDVVIPEIDR
ncbi:MAG: NADH-quinone oxidoreductase subunit D [Calditrichaeota bacterium]|nr:NADH-quinone oxidoreductase subunit D [Calditrichota bacterium]MCB9367604.1 NADH-quinone oxidoreductase subunit D [Calditrichota bacterium]